MTLLFQQENDAVSSSLAVLSRIQKEESKTATQRRYLSKVPLAASRRSAMSVVRQATALFQQKATNSFNGINEDPDSLLVGERVWVWDDGSSAWYQAFLIGAMHDNEGELMWEVEYTLGGRQDVYLDYIRKYVLFKEGDRVEVDYNRDATTFFTGVITHIHPNGGCSVLFEDGEFLEGVQREYMLLLNDNDASSGDEEHADEY